MTDADPALVGKVFHVPKRKRKSDIHHNRELDNLRRRFELAKRIGVAHRTMVKIRQLPMQAGLV